MQRLLNWSCIVFIFVLLFQIPQSSYIGSRLSHTSTYNPMGESRGRRGGGQGSGSPLKNHKWLNGSLEILVRIQDFLIGVQIYKGEFDLLLLPDYLLFFPDFFLKFSMRMKLFCRCCCC